MSLFTKEIIIALIAAGQFSALPQKTSTASLSNNAALDPSGGSSLNYSLMDSNSALGADQVQTGSDIGSSVDSGASSDMKSFFGGSGSENSIDASSGLGDLKSSVSGSDLAGSKSSSSLSSTSSDSSSSSDYGLSDPKPSGARSILAHDFGSKPDDLDSSSSSSKPSASSESILGSFDSATLPTSSSAIDDIKPLSTSEYNVMANLPGSSIVSGQKLQEPSVAPSSIPVPSATMNAAVAAPSPNDVFWAMRPKMGANVALNANDPMWAVPFLQTDVFWATRNQATAANALPIPNVVTGTPTPAAVSAMNSIPTFSSASINYVQSAMPSSSAVLANLSLDSASSLPTGQVSDDTPSTMDFGSSLSQSGLGSTSDSKKSSEASPVSMDDYMVDTASTTKDPKKSKVHSDSVNPMNDMSEDLNGSLGNVVKSSEESKELDVTDEKHSLSAKASKKEKDLKF